MDKWIQLMSEDGTDNLFPVSKMDLLWTNSSPGSAFAGQTVSLDLTSYRAVLIYARLYMTYNGSCASFIALKGEPTAMSQSGGYNSEFSGGIFATRRMVTMTDTGVAFGNSWDTGNYGNNCSVPYKIYGIK